MPLALSASPVVLNDALVGGLTLNGVVSGSSSYGLETLSGNVTLGGANTFAGPLTIGSGDLTIASSGALGGASGTNYGGAIANNGVLTNNSALAQTWSGVISGAGSLVVVGSGGVLTLAATNTYAGGTTVNAGTLKLDNGGSNGCVVGALTINPGGRFSPWFKTPSAMAPPPRRSPT